MQIEIRNSPHNCLTSNTTINEFVDRAHETMEYNYDFNGNMTEDKNKAVTVKYNLQNLPMLVDWGKGRKIEWLYSADGTKLRKNVYDNGHLNTITDYANGFEYETVIDPNAAEGTVPVPELQSFAMSEGRIVNVGGTLYYNYHLKDHLGNVRVTFSNEPGAPKITGRNFYYPFGLRIATTLSNPENKYLYNGKELEEDHGLYWYHYGARYYDPQLGRWHTMDPADEFNSPYLYVGNNPVMLVDPDGRQVELSYVQQELNSTWNTGEQLVKDYAYNDLPKHLDCFAAATFWYLPELSFGASALSTALTMAKDYDEGGGINNADTWVSITTTALGYVTDVPKLRPLGQAIALFQVYYDFDRKLPTNNIQTPNKIQNFANSDATFVKINYRSLNAK